MKKLLLIVPLIVCLSCELEWDDSTIYHQFTSDDLQYLYYGYDTLTNIGNDIYYRDTASFLLNSKDTIVAPIITHISSSKPYLVTTRHEYIYGQSDIYLPEITGFKYLQVEINRQNVTGNIEKWFYVGLKKPVDCSFNKVIRTYDDSISMDTALILNRIYQNVYKFTGNEDYNSRFKSVYFAKKYGFIKIESIDGVKLELIKIKSKPSGPDY